MDTISLPMIQSEISLEEAFDVMKSAGRSGIVWQRDPTDFRLYTACEIVVSLAGGKTQLVELTGDDVDLPDITAIAQETPEPYLDAGRLGKTLHGSRKYGVLAAGQSGTRLNAMLLLSATGLLAELESSPEDCYCEKCTRPGPRGGTCRRDGSTIKCR